MNNTTIAELEKILSDGHHEIDILPNGEVITSSRFASYRELLETWLKWWYGPAKDCGLHGQTSVYPPISDTIDAIKCSICTGIVEDGNTCAACGRDLVN